MLNFFNKDKKPPVVEKKLLPPEDYLKKLIDDFLNKSTIAIVDEGRLVRISPAKWLYPGYGEYKDHAIICSKGEKFATEIVRDTGFVKKFLRDEHEIDGVFGYFLARIEGSYIKIADTGATMFAELENSAKGDQELLILIRQSNRLFPKLNTESFTIEMRHVEAFGKIFNQLKSLFYGNYNHLTPERRKMLSVDVPTYTSSLVKIENSIDSYVIFNLVNTLEKAGQDMYSVTHSKILEVTSEAMERIHLVKEMLAGSHDNPRFLRARENLEKIYEHLNDIAAAVKKLA